MHPRLASCDNRITMDQKDATTAVLPNGDAERLRADRRLLGRLLGEVIREQIGAGALELIENIRRSAVILRRGDAKTQDAGAIAAARSALDRTLNSLSIDDTLHVVRAFSYFLHLVNIAEDTYQHGGRDAAAPAMQGDLARALARAKENGISGAQLVEWFSTAIVAPVLTAHPTEVQRQAILECERKIARLLAQSGAAAAQELALRREVLRLWLTAMLRLTKLTVADEIENGLACFRTTFLEQLPRLYADLENTLAAEFGVAREVAVAPFLRVGTWIGGDRDGNPNVNAGVLTHALNAQARLVVEHYLNEVRLLSTELTVAARLVPPPPELAAFAAASGDTSPHRGDEPYRQALTGIYARLAATGAQLAQLQAVPAALVDKPPYANAAEFAADLDLITGALTQQGAGLLADGRLKNLRRAVSIFGFHLAAIDLRQSSDMHAETVAELLAKAGVVADYQSLDEAANGRVAAHPAITSPRRLGGTQPSRAGRMGVRISQ